MIDSGVFKSKSGQCPREDYEQKAFWQCLYRHAIPVALVLQKFKPEIFREDMEMLREISDVRDARVLKAELDRFYGRNLRDRSRLRRILLIRVSAGRVLKLKRRVFGEEG